jgi:hypothetical protein
VIPEFKRVTTFSYIFDYILVQITTYVRLGYPVRRRDYTDPKAAHPHRTWLYTIPRLGGHNDGPDGTDMEDVAEDAEGEASLEGVGDVDLVDLPEDDSDAQDPQEQPA